MPSLETLKDLFSATIEEYCGYDKFYKGIVILFDEFGKYIEFATERPAVAGSGVLQDLFEAIQSSNGMVSFTGFIQFELQAYVQRMRPELKNEAMRYITRYDSAEKTTLSTNMETLIVNLIEKKNRSAITRLFESEEAEKNTERTLYYLHKYFRESAKHTLWKDVKQFHIILRKNCWPLSPFALWFFSALASGSRFLQGRSVLALLRDTFARLEQQDACYISYEGYAPTNFFSDDLLEEFISSENLGNQGSIAQSLKTVLARHEARLSTHEITLLKAIVIASKLGMVADSREDAELGLHHISGLSVIDVQGALHRLQQEMNVVEWDNGFNAFEILSDAIPRTQFLSFLRQRLGSDYDEHKQSQLFIKHINSLVANLQDIESDFGDHHKINTKEWIFSSVVTNETNLDAQVSVAFEGWQNAKSYDKAKGTVLYVYVKANCHIEEARQAAQKSLKKATHDYGIKVAPVMISLLHDVDGTLGTCLAEYDILTSLTPKEQEQFKNLVPAHQEKLQRQCEDLIKQCQKKCETITLVKEADTCRRLKAVGQLLFEKTYSYPLTFPFDGFSGKGNGPTTAYDFARQLFHGNLTIGHIQSLSIKEKNRAYTVLRDAWDCYEKNGSIRRIPQFSALARLFKAWDTRKKTEHLNPRLMLTTLLAPPYGANTHSALLAIAVYVAARHGEFHVHVGGEAPLTMAMWAEKLFASTRRSIDSNFFGTAELAPAGDASQEWDELLDEWEACERYDELAGFPEKASVLRKRVPLSEAHRIRLGNVEKKSEYAQEKRDQYDNIYERALKDIIASQEQKKFGSLIYGTASLQKLINMHENNPDAWPNENLRKLENEFGQAREYTLRGFDEWLTTENPRSENPNDIADFKTKMDKFAVQLNIAKLEEQKEKLKISITKKCQRAETLASYRRKLDEVQAWIPVASRVKNMPMKELKAQLDEHKSYAQALTLIAKNVDLKGVQEAREQLATYKNTLEEQRKILEKQLRSFTRMPLMTVEDIRSCNIEGKRLRLLFEETPDYEDIKDACSFLEWLQRASKDMDDIAVTDDIIHEKIDTFAKECAERIEEYELPWDAEKLILDIQKEIIQHRQEKSADWIRGFEAKCHHIKDLDVKIAQSLYVQLQTMPACVQSEHKKQANAWIDALEQHLASMKIDWLVQEFKALSVKQQETALAKMQKLLEI